MFYRTLHFFQQKMRQHFTLEMGEGRNFADFSALSFWTIWLGGLCNLPGLTGTAEI
jgi:hypothetical protein